MRNLSEEFITSAVRYETRLQLPDGTDVPGEIKALTVTSALNGSTECLTLGAASAATLNCTIDSPGTILRDTKVRLLIGRTVNGVLEEIPFGVYTITEAKDSEGAVELTGYDAMATEMEMGYFPENALATAKGVLSDLCAQAGVELVVPEDAADVAVAVSSGYTRREMIGYMAALLGCSACMDDTGRLALRWFTPSGLTVEGDTIYSGGLELADSDWTLSKIECSVTTAATTEETDEEGNTTTNTTENTETLTAGDGTTGLSLSNPYMAQDILDSVFLRIGGLAYRGGTVSLFGDLRHEVGDIVTVVDYNGVSHAVPVMQITHEYDGGLKTTIAAYAKSETESGVSASGPLTQAMERYAAELALFKNVTADNVTATNAKIKSLRAETAELQSAVIGKADIADLDVVNADIEALQAAAAALQNAVIQKADITDLEAANAALETAIIGKADIAQVTAVQADIERLETEKLSATDAELKYANIDFANIGEAAILNLYSKSGIIQNLVSSDGVFTGELVGVTIKGDLIEGGTVVADKLVVKGEDGLYYKLNTDGVSIEAEQTEYNSLSGSVITAKSITATKVAVDDLVAFDATIGGFNITENSLYSGVKSSVDNTTRGIYLDNTGQIAFGDASNYLKYYYDETGKKWKLSISAQSIVFGASGASVEDEIEALKDEITTFLYIGSSNGTVFKNDNISTVLTVTVYRGSERITDMETLKSLMGDTVTLQWSFQRLSEETYYMVDSNDSRIGNDGFTFTLTSDDVDAKATFICELIV